MKAYTYIKKGEFALVDKQKPAIIEPTDAIVRVTLGSICSSDLHIKHGSVPRAVPGITVGHEMVGIVEQLGTDVKGFKVGDRVTVNVETFCGECFYCKHGYVNNCTSPHGMATTTCRANTLADTNPSSPPDTKSQGGRLLACLLRFKRTLNEGFRTQSCECAEKFVNL